MSKAKARKKVVKKVAKKTASKKSSPSMMAADVKLAITTPVRVGMRRKASLFPRELAAVRGKE